MNTRNYRIAALLSSIIVKLAGKAASTSNMASRRTLNYPAFLGGLLAALILLSGCSSNKGAFRDNFSDLYDAEQIQIRHNKKIFHSAKDETTIYFKIPASDLTFEADENDLQKEAVALLSLKVFPANPELLKAVDSILVKLDEVSTDNEHSYLHTAVKLNLPDGFAFRAELLLTDVNSGESQRSVFSINKTDPNHRQNFLVFQTDKKLPVYEDYVTRPQRLRIKNNQQKDMTVRYYGRYFPLPPPPFSSFTPPPFQYQADSIFTIRATPDFSIFEPTKTGFYHITINEDQKQGFTLFTYPDPFPAVGEPQQMFEALRYLTTEWEHREMKQSGNVRQSVEEKWLEFAGSKNKAREMIQLYYGRVEEANQFFTSYTEGWRTDRGLIHVIFGKPNIIYKGANSETWIYGEDKNVMSLSFTFVKVINPFTDNDYRLDRDENYKAAWYRAIESWRNGRIYAN